MEDPRRRFTATAEAYRHHRPDYPDAAIDWLLAGGEVHDVVDLGSGTGLATRQIAARGVRVVGVEPNDAMREAAQAEGGGPVYVKGEADATGLPTGSADRVVAAQAFHWFPLHPTLREIDRLLRPGGSAIAMWNLRDLDDPFMAAYEALLGRWSSEVGKVPRGGATIAAITEAVGEVARARFVHAQPFDRAGLRGRAWSSSYVAHGVADRVGFDAALDALFDAHQADGRVWFRYRTELVRWPRRAG